jgi:septum formation protein
MHPLQAVKDKNIILGSTSPRRKELLAQVDLPFIVQSIDCQEDYPINTPVHEITAYLAEKKAKAFGAISNNQVLITADTLVVLGNEVLGKPKSTAEAKAMLQKLSGKTHEVFTSICVCSEDKHIIHTEKTKLWVQHLTQTEIDYYVENYKPLDKAGAYGIQEWFGQVAIHKIEGCYYNVMGLPLAALYQVLKNF